MMGTCTIWGLMLNPVAAASFTTTFSFLGDDRELVFDWAGSDLNDDGFIIWDDEDSLNELSAWSLRLVESGSVVFEDVIVENSVVVGGPRAISFSVRETNPGSFSDFDDFDNDTNGDNVLSGFINIFANGSWVRFNNRLPQNRLLQFDLELSGASTTAAVSTPEPSLILGFITLGGVMLLGSKRKTKG